MEGQENRSAYFKSVVAYIEPGLKSVMFSGEVHGHIGFEARGDKGFGYDPIFYVGEVSMAEMESGGEEPNLSSRSIHVISKKMA